MQRPGQRAPLIAALALLVATVLATPTMAQNAPTTFTSHLHSGTCDQPGEAVAALTALAVPAGPVAGVATSSTANAYSTVQATLESILAIPFSIDIHDSASGSVVACGEIGGVLNASGGLTVGLRPMSEAGFSGIAYLSPVAGDPSQTGISVFIAQTGVAPAGKATPLDAGTYGTTVRSQLTLVVGSLQRVDLLFDAPQASDPAWITQLTAELSLWQLMYGEALEMVPPGAYADFHQRYVAALAMLDSAATDIMTGLANGDQALLAQADEKISQAIAALRALEGTPSGTPEASPAAAT